MRCRKCDGSGMMKLSEGLCEDCERDEEDGKDKVESKRINSENSGDAHRRAVRQYHREEAMVGIL
jgi:hypothetical protein